MTKNKEKLRQLVTDFRKWLSGIYTTEEINTLKIDDTGYPKWDEVEHFFSEILAKKLISVFDQEDKINLLYLIARNWDIANMIAWLSNGPQLSNLGDLPQEDFIVLAETAVTLDGAEFADAKSQIASSFKKLGVLTDEVKTILLKFYNDKDEYTKRHALMTLGKLGYANIRQLVHQSWQMNDEHHKAGCLDVVYYLNDPELMKEYLLLADEAEGEHLKEYAKKLRKHNNY